MRSITKTLAALAALGSALTAQSSSKVDLAPSIRSLACPADGRLLASATDAGISIRTRADGKLLREVALPAAPLQLAWAADGSILAAACADGSVRLIDPVARKGTRVLHCGATSVAFLPDGQLLCGDRGGRVTALPTAMLALAAGASVDLRPNYERWGLAPRRQGHRGTCSVFTAAAAYEYALSRQQDRGEPLSDEFLNWAANAASGRVDDGSFFHEAIAGFDRFGICRAELMPYGKAFDPTQKPSAKALQDGERVRALGLTVHWINPWRPQAGLQPEHLAAIKQVLERGWPVCLGSSHSTLAVGYADDAAVAGGGSLVIRDSAIGDYRTLTCEFVLAKIGDVFWVEPTPPRN